MVKPNKIFLKINNNSIDLALSNRTPENKFQKFILEELNKYYQTNSTTTTTSTTTRLTPLKTTKSSTKKSLLF
jgi:hypothetical protein